MDIQWPLVLFTLLSGTGAGTLVAAGISEFLGASSKTRFLAGIVSLLLLAAGGLFSVAHLGQAGNFMAAISNIGSLSGISLELISLGVAVVVALVYALVTARDGNASKVIGIVGIVAGAAFAFLSGHGYEAVTVRPAWATPALSLSYLLNALTAGGFVFIALQSVKSDDAGAVKRLALVVGIAAALQAVAYLAYGILAPLGNTSVLHWGGAVLVGGLVSLAIGILIYIKGSSAAAWVGVAAALAGGLAFRAVMWLVGQAYLPNLFDIASQNRGLFPM